MNIQFDTQFEQAKTLQELTKLLNQTFEQLRNALQQQPNFLVVTSDDQSIPKNTPVNTIVFKFDETLAVQTGYYNGEDIILPP